METYVLDSRLAGTEQVKKTKGVTGSGSYSSGYKREMKTADLFVQRLKGIGEGDPSLYTEYQGDLETPGDKGRYLETDALNEYTLGGGDDAPNIEKIVYDKESGNVAVITSADQYEDFPDARYLNWMPEEALYSEVGIKVLEGQKAIPRAAVEDYIHKKLPPKMRSMGEVWLQSIEGAPGRKENNTISPSGLPRGSVPSGATVR